MEQIKTEYTILKSIVENLKEVYWLRDFDHFIYISPAYEAIWGRSRESLYKDPDTYTTAWHPDDKKRILNNYDKKRFFSREKIEETYRVIRPDGSIRWVLARSFPIEQDGDGPVRRAGIAEDITEQVLMEHALRENEEQFRSIIERMPYPIHVLDQAGNIVTRNQVAREILDLNTSEKLEKTQSKNSFKDSLLSDIKVRELIKKAYNGETVINSKVVIPVEFLEKKYGMRQPQDTVIELTVFPVYKPKDTVWRVVIIAQDITERILSEKALRESEEKFRHLVENINDAVVVFNPVLEVIYFSPHILKLNLDESFFSGAKDLNFVYEADRDRVKNELEKIQSMGKPCTFEFRIKDKTGSLYWFESRSKILMSEDGKDKNLFSVLRDITERKTAEDKIKVLSSAVMQSNDGIIIINLDNRVSYINPAFRNMTGYGESDYMDKDLSSFHSPQSMHLFKDVMEQIKMKGNWKGQVDFIRKDGSSFPGMVSVNKLKTDNGSEMGLLMVVQDISALMEKNKELEQKNQALKEILASIELEKKEIRNTIASNFERLVMPFINNLSNLNNLDDSAINYVNLIRQNLESIQSPFIRSISNRFASLSQREIELCHMIKNGLRSCEIAQMLNLSQLTIETHRNKIRKKLGIDKKKVNLATYLNQIM
ncbi:MAG: PAS domain S-box protein [Spirochaetales bacterium]|nr:PAS domain S-box protein [Spirochaetales bacterium]